MGRPAPAQAVMPPRTIPTSLKPASGISPMRHRPQLGQAGGEHARMTTDVLPSLATAVAGAEPVALATVIYTTGGSPARPGFKLLVHRDGRWEANVGGGELEQRVRAAALEALELGVPRTEHYALTETGPDATGTLCGGEVTVFVEP